MEILNAEQRSQEWHEARLGRFTASEIHRLLTEPKLAEDKKAGNLSDGAMTYVEERADERITGLSSDDELTTKEMEWGIEYEPVACKYYEKVYGVTTEQIGLVSKGDYLSVSPDRLIGDIGGIEIKCPYKRVNHLKNLRLKTQDDVKKEHKDYYWQCVMGMWICDRKWWDFVSFHPSYPTYLRLQVIRIHRRDEDIKLLETKTTKAISELESILKSLVRED